MYVNHNMPQNNLYQILLELIRVSKMVDRFLIIAACIYRFVMIRLDNYETYGHCFYETSLVL